MVNALIFILIINDICKRRALHLIVHEFNF